jgi:folate-binding protein YgfZ
VAGDAQHEAHDGALAAVSAPASLDAWRAADIHAGLPWIEAGLQDTVIPQTVNFDLIGGVNFRKGCYPGQEIVARSHYLGKVKRRAVVGHSTGDVPAAGTDVYLAGDPQPNGRVINAAAIPGGVALLFETTLASTDTPLHVGSADGPPIALQSLPYPLDTHGD